MTSSAFAAGLPGCQEACSQHDAGLPAGAVPLLRSHVAPCPQLVPGCGCPKQSVHRYQHPPPRQGKRLPSTLTWRGLLGEGVQTRLPPQIPSNLPLSCSTILKLCDFFLYSHRVILLFLFSSTSHIFHHNTQGA